NARAKLRTSAGRKAYQLPLLLASVTLRPARDTQCGRKITMPVSDSELMSAETICMCISSSFFTEPLPGGRLQPLAAYAMPGSAIVVTGADPPTPPRRTAKPTASPLPSVDDLRTRCEKKFRPPPASASRLDDHPAARPPSALPRSR